MNDVYAQKIVAALFFMLVVFGFLGIVLCGIVGNYLASIRDTLRELAAVGRGEERRSGYTRRKEDMDDDPIGPIE